MLAEIPGLQFADPAKLNLKKVRKVRLGQLDNHDTCVGGWISVDDIFTAVGGEGCMWNGRWKNAVKYVDFDDEANVAIIKPLMIFNLFEYTPSFAFLNISDSQVDALTPFASVV